MESKPVHTLMDPNTVLLKQTDTQEDPRSTQPTQRPPLLDMWFQAQLRNWTTVVLALYRTHMLLPAGNQLYWIKWFINILPLLYIIIIISNLLKTLENAWFLFLIKIGIKVVENINIIINMNILKCFCILSANSFLFPPSLSPCISHCSIRRSWSLLLWHRSGGGQDLKCIWSVCAWRVTVG